MIFNQYQEFGQKQYVRSASESYLKLMPLINDINPSNYYELLVETLRECLHQISLDNFYNLVFNNYSPGFNFPAPINGKKVDNSNPLPFENEGLTLCFYILETFRHPFTPVGNFATGLVNNPLFSRIRFHEVQRVFLAAKIMFDSVIEIKGSLDVGCSIPRHSIKEGYQLICEKLASIYPSTPEFTFPQNHLAIGLLQLGRVTRTIYPQLTTKRIGRRGESKHHYLGIIWNNAIVDNELYCLIQRQTEIPANHLIQTQDPVPKEPVSSEPERRPEVCEKGLQDSLCYKSSTYSYVDGYRKYPLKNCLPRSWEFIPGVIPQQSKWANEIMWKSAAYLKEINVDVVNLIQNFNVLILSSGKIFFAFDELLSQLIQQLAPNEAYLHLYLILLLLYFPVFLASESEISKQNKLQISDNLTEFINTLQMSLGIMTLGNPNHFLNFTNILKKMINLAQLTLSHVKTRLVKKTITEFSQDLSKIAASPENTAVGETTGLNELLFKSIFMTIKAVSYDFIEEGIQIRLSDNHEMIKEIANQFEECYEFVKNTILQIPENMSEEDLEGELYDVSFQIFKLQLQLVHDIWLAQPLILQLPIRAISFIIQNMHKEFQEISFGDFGRREHEVSKETFKVWWVCSATIGEYISILSEIVGLSERLFVREGKNHAPT